MLEDLKNWWNQKQYEWKRSSLRNEFSQHIGHNNYAKATEVGLELYNHEKAGLGAAHDSTLQTLAAYAAMLVDAGKHADAEKYWREYLAIKRSSKGDSDIAVGQTLRMLGRLTLRLNRIAESVAFYEEALELQNRLLGEDHRETNITLTELEQLKKNQQLDQAHSKPKAAAVNTLVPPGTVIFAIWVRRIGEPSGVPQLLGDLEDAFGHGKGITVGSSPECTIVLDDPAVAPVHLHIDNKGGVRKMQVHARTVVPHESWEFPLETCEAEIEAGMFMQDPIGIRSLRVGPFELEYRELRDNDAEELVKYAMAQPPSGPPPEAPLQVSKLRGPFLPRERELAGEGRWLAGIFIPEGLTARQLSTLGKVLSDFRGGKPYVVRIEGLQELFSGRCPVFGDTPTTVYVDNINEATVGAAEWCLLVECRENVDINTLVADLQPVIPAGSVTAVRELPYGAIRLANFKRRREPGSAPAPVEADPE